MSLVRQGFQAGTDVGWGLTSTWGLLGTNAHKEGSENQTIVFI